MNLKQEAWVLYLRATLVNGAWEMHPYWGRVGELKSNDVLWNEDLRKFICIIECHKELDMLSLDKILEGYPDEMTMVEVESKIIEVTETMFAKTSYTPGKPAKNCFSRKSMLYPGTIPDCIKDRFKMMPPESY